MRIPRDCFAISVAKLLHNTRSSVTRIVMCELVAKVLNMFKREFYAIPPPSPPPPPQKKKKKYSRTRGKCVARLSYDYRFDVHASVAILSPRNFGKFTTRHFCDTCTNVVRQSRDSLEKACEHMMKTCP